MCDQTWIGQLLSHFGDARSCDTRLFLTVEGFALLISSIVGPLVTAWALWFAIVNTRLSAMMAQASTESLQHTREQARQAVRPIIVCTSLRPTSAEIRYLIEVKNITEHPAFLVTVVAWTAGLGSTENAHLYDQPEPLLEHEYTFKFLPRHKRSLDEIIDTCARTYNVDEGVLQNQLARAIEDGDGFVLVLYRANDGSTWLSRVHIQETPTGALEDARTTPTFLDFQAIRLPVALPDASKPGFLDQLKARLSGIKPR